jgi:hypothetical protein
MSQKGVVRLRVEGLGYKMDLISEDSNGVPGVRNGMITETLSSREACFGIIFNDDYYLWLNGTIWVLQTNLIRQEGGQTVYPWIPWKPFTNARSFAIKDNDLYFGGLGNIYKFGLYNTDDGSAVDSFWQGKKFTPVDFTICLIPHVNYSIGMTSGIATSSMDFTVYASGVSATSTMTFTPTSSYIEYPVRQNVSWKTPTIQYMIRENSTSGAFDLQKVEIEYMPDRRLK